MISVNTFKLNIFLFIENYNQRITAEVPEKSYGTANLRLQLRHPTLVSDGGTHTYISALNQIKYMYLILFIYRLCLKPN